VTIGDDLNSAAHFLSTGRESYSAAEVVKELLSKVQEPAPQPELAVAL
jgi:hypothetical protein